MPIGFGSHPQGLRAFAQNLEARKRKRQATRFYRDRLQRKALRMLARKRLHCKQRRQQALLADQHKCQHVLLRSLSEWRLNAHKAATRKAKVKLHYELQLHALFHSYETAKHRTKGF